MHGFKRAQSRDDLVVADLALRQQPWVAIYCKTPPNPLDKQATREHAENMQKVKECLQSKHGFESQEQCQWALLPPTDVDGFVSGKNLAIARVGGTSDVRKVEKQRLNALSFDQAQAKYSEIAGLLAADNLRSIDQHLNRGNGGHKSTIP